MRAFIILMLLGSSVSSAHASGADWAAASVLLSGVVGSSMFAYQGGNVTELEGWSDPQQKNTDQLQTGCGVITESRLLGDNGYNFLFLVVKNTSGANVELVYDQLQMNFVGGKNRLPALMHNSSPLTMINSQTIWGLFPFPSKNDFERADEIVIRVPIRKVGSTDACWVETRFARNKAVVDTRAFNSTTSFEMQLGGGMNFLRSGNQSDFSTKGGGAYELGLSGYSGTHWGGTFLLYGNYLNQTDTTKLAPLTMEAGKDPRLSILDMTLAASYRDWLGERFNWIYDLGPALHIAMYDKSGDSEKQSGAFLAFTERLQLNYKISRVREGAGQGDYGVGVGIIHSWTPGFSAVNGVSFGGNSLTWLLHFTIGG